MNARAAIAATLRNPIVTIHQEVMNVIATLVMWEMALVAQVSPESKFNELAKA